MKLRDIIAYAKQRLTEVQKANDKLQATSYRMACRINISERCKLEVLDIPEEILDELLCRRWEALRELNFNVGDIEKIIFDSSDEKSNILLDTLSDVANGIDIDAGREVHDRGE